MIAPPSRNDVHIWQFSLAPNDDWVTRCEACLCPGEITRANKLASSGLRRRFVVGRGGLRHILGKYLKQIPQTVEIEYAAQGKPFLASKQIPLDFNLSHSGDLAVVALTQQHRIGVDIELVVPELEIMDIARRFFARHEFESLMNAPAALRRETFFHYWTCKEAYLKGTGTGFSRELQDCAILLRPHEPPVLLADRTDSAAPARWTFIPLALPAGFVGAAAVESLGQRLKLTSFTPNDASEAWLPMDSSGR